MTRLVMRGLLILLASLLMTACASKVITQNVAVKPFANTASPSSRWQIFCFDMPYEPDTKWYLDTMIIDQILAPELYREQANINLWRFHRRSANDGAGHRLRFLVYAPEDALQRIDVSMNQSLALRQLIESGLVKGLQANCGASLESIDIAATSDPNWTPELQRAWPYFAMGVSGTLLDLIESIKVQIPEFPRDFEQQLVAYAEIQQRMDEIWRNEGQHGFLHHLNALFGYQPLWLQQYSRF